MAIAFERASEIVARQLASFRLGLDADDPFAYTENEKLMAGHIVGALWGGKLLNTEGENWVTVDSVEIRAERERCAKIVEAEAERVLALQKPNADPMSIDDTINLNLRMATVLLPELAARIRADSSSALPREEKP